MYVQYFIRNLRIIAPTREDVRGVAGVVVSTKMIYMINPCHEPMDRWQIVQKRWWALQNLMNLLYSVAFEQNVFVYIFLTLTFCFDAMAPLAWWSVAEAKLITNSTNKYTLITFCSNATEYNRFIKFWSDNHVPWTICHWSIGSWWGFVV